MTRAPGLRAAVALAVLCWGVNAAGAAGKAAGNGGASLLPGSGSKEPISVDAARLDYFNKEQKLVYTGDVVARQGPSTLKGSVLTIFLTKDARKSKADGTADTGTEEAATPAAGPGSGSIDHMEIKGPVTVTSKDEVGTGDNGSYDKASNKIVLTGNVTLTQATNIIKGDRLVYDMTTGQAQVTGGDTQGRVRSVFTPGSASPGTPKKGKAAAPAMPPAAPK